MQGTLPLVAAALSFLLAPAASIRFPGDHVIGIRPQEHSDPTQLGSANFTQLLDHSDPSKGTFQQRIWYDDQWWAGPGSPIFVFNPGESAADGYLGYLENGTVPGYYAQELGGAVVLIEHRYWGQSNPFPENLTAETLQFLTLPQNIADMTYFAQNVQLDFLGNSSNSDSPWVLVGGSYSGALAAWTQALDPGTFYAYHASSAVVEAVYDFYGYYDAVTAAIPAACASDVKAAVAYIDHVFDEGTAHDIADLKAIFGLPMLEHAGDFANFVADPMSAWQDNTTYVFDFCDTLEAGADSSSGDSGVGIDVALPRYADFIKNKWGEYCTQYDCSSYDNAASYNQPAENNGERQWEWMLCNDPLAWWQVGPPTADGQHVISAQLQPWYDQRQCNLTFPPTNGYMAGSVEGFNTRHLNMYTGGWDAPFERVLFVNGQYDPWLTATVGSPHRPGGPRESSADMPILKIANGTHCPDLYFGDLDTAPAPQQAAVKQAVQIMGQWLAGWANSTNHIGTMSSGSTMSSGNKV